MQKHHLGKRNGDLMVTVEINLQPQGTTPAIVASIFDGAIIFINMLKSDASNNALNDYALKSFVIPLSQRGRPVG